MTSIDIYNILSSKPHNPHYLKRYWKFIQWCKEQNKTLLDNVYVEEHHIAPKAKDLFPQYKSFRENPWNKIKLTSHQHILAHVMLWKIYGMSQVKALDAMLGKFSINNVDMLHYLLNSSQLSHLLLLPHRLWLLLILPQIQQHLL